MLLMMEQAGLEDRIDGTGIEIINRPPDQMMISLKQKQIDAALVPEPWATVAVTGEDAPAKVLVPWDAVEPGGKELPVTILVANQRLIQYHEDILQMILKVNRDAVRWMTDEPQASIGLIQDQLKQLTGKKIDTALLESAFSHMGASERIDHERIGELADVALRAGYIKDPERLAGLIYDPEK